VLEHRLLVLGVVVLGVLGDVTELAGDADPLGDVPASFAAQLVELSLERLVALGGENDFPQGSLLLRLRRDPRATGVVARTSILAVTSDDVQPRTISRREAASTMGA
jgi:hypothetical protein